MPSRQRAAQRPRPACRSRTSRGAAVDVAEAGPGQAHRGHDDQGQGVALRNGALPTVLPAK
eukprot:3945604-Alexandrium_andersonii.AAC.1